MKLTSQQKLIHNNHYSTYLKHLGGDDDWLAGNVALGDHHLLGVEDLASGDFDTKVTTGNHNTVCLPKDLVEVGDTLLVLDLDDDLDVSTVGAKDLTDVLDILSTTDEGGEDHIDSVLHAEPEIVLILLRESGQVDIGLGQVNTLAGGERAVVQSTDTDVGAIDRDNEERKNTVIDVDELAGGSNLGQIFLEEQAQGQ